MSEMQVTCHEKTFFQDILRKLSFDFMCNYKSSGTNISKIASENFLFRLLLLNYIK